MECSSNLLYVNNKIGKKVQFIQFSILLKFIDLIIQN
jgi:hypothetical protein